MNARMLRFLQANLKPTVTKTAFRWSNEFEIIIPQHLRWKQWPKNTGVMTLDEFLIGLEGVKFNSYPRGNKERRIAAADKLCQAAAAVVVTCLQTPEVEALRVAIKEMRAVMPSDYDRVGTVEDLI